MITVKAFLTFFFACEPHNNQNLPFQGKWVHIYCLDTFENHPEIYPFNKRMLKYSPVATYTSTLMNSELKFP